MDIELTINTPILATPQLFNETDATPINEDVYVIQSPLSFETEHKLLKTILDVSESSEGSVIHNVSLDLHFVLKIPNDSSHMKSSIKKLLSLYENLSNDKPVKVKFLSNPDGAISENLYKRYARAIRNHNECSKVTSSCDECKASFNNTTNINFTRR